MGGVSSLVATNRTTGSPTRTGLVGYGYWGKKLLAALSASPDFLPTRLHFPSLAVLPGDLRPQVDGLQLTEDLEVLLADPRIDAVLLATPIACHADGVRAALNAGKHVLVEKPLCLDPDQARELQRLALERELHLQTEYTWTFSPGLHQAREILAEGGIGGLRHIQVRLHQLGRFRQEGVYPLLVCHALSIVGLFVDLASLRWTQLDGVGRGSNASTVVLSGSAEDGSSVLIDVSLDDPVRDRCVVLVGDEGTISYRPLGPSPTLLAVRYERLPASVKEASLGHRLEHDFDEGDNIGHALSAFARVLRGEETSNLASSVRITELMARLSAPDGGGSPMRVD